MMMCLAVMPPECQLQHWQHWQTRGAYLPPSMVSFVSSRPCRSNACDSGHDESQFVKNLGNQQAKHTDVGDPVVNSDGCWAAGF